MIEWIKKATSKNITGNYKFYVKSQPETVDNTSTISVTPFTDKSQTAIVPCHYKWFRVRNGLIEQSYKFRGNSYVCDSSDIGAIIQADVVSNDPQYSGQASIQFGPVKLATEIKKHLMDALTTGSTFMRGMVFMTDYQQKQCQFKIFQDMIKICHLQSQLNYSFNYTVIQPRVQIVPKDATKVWITFSHNYQSNPHIFMRNLFGQQYEQFNNINNQCKVQIRFPTRQLKDIFLLTLKAFATKKQLKNSVVIHKIQSSTFNQREDISLLFQIQSLRSDISRLYYSSQQKQKEKQRLSQEVIRLQRQIQQIITTYTRIAEDKFRSTRDLNQSYAVLTNKRDEVFGKKCQNLQKQNMGLNQRIRMLTAQIDQIRLNSSMAKRDQTSVNMNLNQNQPHYLQNHNPNQNQNLTTVTSIKMKSQMPRNDMTSFDHNMLAELAESRVSQFNQQAFQMTKQLEKVNQQKFQLQRKLQKSFRTIDELEKKIVKSPPQNYSTVINFNKAPQINTSSYSLAVDLQKIQLENSRLVGMNESLKKQNQNLQKQIQNNSSSRIIIKPNPISSSVVSNQIKFNQSKVSVARQNTLALQNENLKKQINILQQKLKSQEAKVAKYLRDKTMLERKLDDANNQLQMYKRNQQVLNRSSHLSMQMETYNQEKMKVLKDHNDFLLGQNEKLSKACEKYMTEARQNIQLRKQLLQLKQKLGPKLNPQRQSKSIFSGSGFNTNNIQQFSQIIGRNI